MAAFTISYSDTVPVSRIACVEDVLRAIGPGPVVQNDGYFSALLNWGTDLRSRNNLMGKLNGTCGLGTVTSVTSP